MAIKKTVEDYLAIGYTLPYARYFAEGGHKITNVQYSHDYCIHIEFDNKEIREYDCSAFIRPHNIFWQIRDIDEFKKVYINESNCITWPGELDLDRATCYVESKPLNK